MSKGYADEPTDLPQGAPYWHPSGAYGYFFVEERTIGKTGCKDDLRPMTKKMAQKVSDALNQAYHQGMIDGWREAATAFIRTGSIPTERPEDGS